MVVLRICEMCKDATATFEQEIMKSTQSQFVCPLLNKHGKDMSNFKYGNTKLVEGWILQGKERSRR